MVQLVERLLAKEKVTGSNPVARSGATGWWQMAGIAREPVMVRTHLRSAHFFGDVAKLVRQGSAKP